MYIKNIAYNFLIKYRINNLNFNFNLLEEVALSNGWQLCSYVTNKDLILSLNLEKNMELDAFTFISKDKILYFIMIIYKLMIFCSIYYTNSDIYFWSIHLKMVF